MRSSCVCRKAELKKLELIFVYVSPFVFQGRQPATTSTIPLPTPAPTPPPVAAACTPCHPCPTGQRVDPNSVDLNGCSTCLCKPASILGKVCPDLNCPACSSNEYRNLNARTIDGCPVCGPCVPVPDAYNPEISKCIALHSKETTHENLAPVKGTT